MPSLQIRHLPDDIYDALSYRAKREHRSLTQQAVTDLRRITALETNKRRLATLDKIREDLAAQGGATLTPPPEELIRKERDR